MKKAVVTGANGFIGTALCRELSNQGINIIAVVKNREDDITKLKDLKGIRIVYCDLSSIINLGLLIQDRDIDVLYHLAWVGSAGLLRGDYNVQVNNIMYTCDTVIACKKLNCKKLVFASSIMEYEIEKLMSTDSVPDINSLYSSAKIASDFMARAIAAKYGIEYIRAVISNIYGPEEYSPRLINSSIRKMIKGEHCSFSAGEQIYDFIYISDAAKAFTALGKSGVANRTYYIGSLCPKPLKEFLIEMRNQVDSSIEIGIGEIPFNGVTLNYDEFDIEAVKKDTGFEPLVDFSTGIQNTLKWIREN